MKKFLVFLLSLFILTSCNKTIVLNEENYKEVSFSEILDKIENKESFIYFVGTSSCSSCKDYKKTLSKFFKNNNDKIIYYVDAEENFKKGSKYESYYEVLALSAYHLYGKDFGYEKSVLYTPTTFRIVKGEYSFASIGAINENFVESLYSYQGSNISYYNIDIDQTLSLINGTNDYYLYFGQEGCPNCLEFRLLLNRLNRFDNEIKLYYLNINNDIIQNQYDKFLQLVVYYNNVFDLPMGEIPTLNVPSLFKQVDNKVTGIEGVKGFETYLEFFK